MERVLGRPVASAPMSATVILVHGAWHGAWCWERVVPELAARGIDTVAVDLPGHGASTEPFGDMYGDAASVRQAQSTRSTARSCCADTRTVASSSPKPRPVIPRWSTSCTSPCSRPRWANPRWRRCRLPPDGAPSDLAAAVRFSDDGAVATVDPDLRDRRVLPRLHRRRRGARVARLGAQPAVTFSQAVTAAAWHDIPSTYVVCTDDQRGHDVAPARTGVRAPPTPRTGHTSHSPFLSRPALVIDLLERLSPAPRRSDRAPRRSRAAEPGVLGRGCRRLPRRARRGTRRRRPTPGACGGCPKPSCRCSATCPVSTCSSTGAARRSGRSRSARTGARVVGLDQSRGQLRHARRLVHAGAAEGARRGARGASGERVPLADESFDVVFCDHGAMSFCEPARSVPEVARLLRPGGRLAFSHTTPWPYITWSRKQERVTRELRARYFGMHRLDAGEGAGTIDFQLPYGEWIRILRRHGFVIDDLIELRAPKGASTEFADFDAGWARRWPAEQIWKVHKP